MSKIFKILFSVKIQVIYSIASISAVQQSDPVMHIYTFFFSHCLPSCSIPRDWIESSLCCTVGPHCIHPKWISISGFHLTFLRQKLITQKFGRIFFLMVTPTPRITNEEKSHSLSLIVLSFTQQTFLIWFIISKLEVRVRQTRK